MRQGWLRNAGPSIVFSVLFVLTVVVVELVSPLGGGLDEIQHVARVDQLMSGDVSPVFVDHSGLYEGSDLAGTDVAAEYGGYVDTNLYRLAYDEQTKLHATEEAYALPAWEDSGLAGTAYGSDGRSLRVFSNTVINNPIVYLPSLVGALIARALVGTTGGVLVGMRIGGVVAFFLLMLLSIRVAPRFMGWVVAFVGLLPNTIATVAFVSADTMTIALAMLFLSCWASLMTDGRGDTREARIRMGLTVASGVLLGVAKLVYVPLTLLLLLVPLVRSESRSGHDVTLAVGVPAASFVLCLLQSLSIRGINTGAMFKGGVDPSGQAQWILSHPLGFIRRFLMCMSQVSVGQEGTVDLFTRLAGRGVVGYVSWLLVPCYCLLFVIVLRQVALECRPFVQGPGRRATIIALVLELLLISGLVCLGLYATFCEVGAEMIEGVQMRYFIPVVPLLVLAPVLLCFSDSTGTETGRSIVSLRRTEALFAALMAVVELSLLCELIFALYW